MRLSKNKMIALALFGLAVFFVSSWQTRPAAVQQHKLSTGIRGRKWDVHGQASQPTTHQADVSIDRFIRRTCEEMKQGIPAKAALCVESSETNCRRIYNRFVSAPPSSKLYLQYPLRVCSSQSMPIRKSLPCFLPGADWPLACYWAYHIIDHVNSIGHHISPNGYHWPPHKSNEVVILAT